MKKKTLSVMFSYFKALLRSHCRPTQVIIEDYDPSPSRNGNTTPE